MKITIFYLAVLGYATALPNGYYHQEYNYKTSASSYKNNELQHKTDDQGYFKKDGDLEGRVKPKIDANSEHSEYVNPNARYGGSQYGGLNTDFSSAGNMRAQTGLTDYGTNNLAAEGVAHSDRLLGSRGYSSGYSSGYDSNIYGSNSQLYGTSSNLRVIMSRLQQDLEREVQEALRQNNLYPQTRVDISQLETELRRNLTDRLNAELISNYGQQMIRGGMSYSLTGGRLQSTANYDNEELSNLKRQLENSLLNQLRTYSGSSSSSSQYYNRQSNYGYSTTARPVYYQTYPSIPTHTSTVRYPISYDHANYQRVSNVRYTPVTNPQSITTIASRVQSQMDMRLNDILDDVRRTHFSSDSAYSLTNTDVLLERIRNELRSNLTFLLDEDIRKNYGTQIQRDGYLYSIGPSGQTSTESNYSLRDLENLKQQVERNLIEKLNRDFETHRSSWSSHRSYNSQSSYGSNYQYSSTPHYEYISSPGYQYTTPRYDTYTTPRQSIYSLYTTPASHQNGYIKTGGSASSNYEYSSGVQQSGYGVQSSGSIAQLQSQLQDDLSRELRGALSKSQYSSYSSNGVYSPKNYQTSLQQLTDELNRNLSRHLQQYSAMGSYSAYGNFDNAQMQRLQTDLRNSLMSQLQQSLQKSYQASSSYSSSSSSSSNFQGGQYRSGLETMAGEDCAGDDSNAYRHFRAKRSFGSVLGLFGGDDESHPKNNILDFGIHFGKGKSQQIASQTSLEEEHVEDSRYRSHHHLPSYGRTYNEAWGYRSGKHQLLHQDQDQLEVGQQIDDSEDLVHGRSYRGRYQAGSGQQIHDSDLTQQVEENGFPSHGRIHNDAWGYRSGKQQLSHRDQDQLEVGQQIDDSEDLVHGRSYRGRDQSELGQQIDDTDLTQQVEENGFPSHGRTHNDAWGYRSGKQQLSHRDQDQLEVGQQIDDSEDLVHGRSYRGRDQAELGQQIDDSDLTQQVEENGFPSHGRTHNDAWGYRSEKQQLSHRDQDQLEVGQPIDDSEDLVHGGTYRGRHQSELGQQIDDTDLTQQVEENGFPSHGRTHNDAWGYRSGKHQLSHQDQDQLEVGQQIDDSEDLLHGKSYRGQDQAELGQQIDDSALTQQVEKSGYGKLQGSSQGYHTTYYHSNQQQVELGQVGENQYGNSHIRQQKHNLDQAQQLEDTRYGKLEVPNHGRRTQYSSHGQELDDSESDGHGNLQFGQQTQQQTDIIKPEEHFGHGRPAVSNQDQVEVGQQVDDSDLTQQIEDSGFNKHNFEHTPPLGQQIDNSDDTFKKLSVEDQTQQQVGINKPDEPLGYRRIEKPHHGQEHEIGQIEDSDLTPQVEDGPGYLTKPVRQVTHDGQTEIGQQVEDADLTQQIEETGQQIDNSDDTQEISGLREQSQYVGRDQQVEQLEYSRYETPNQGRRLELGQQVEDADLTQQVEDSSINKYVQQPTELGQHAQQQTGLIEPTRQYGQVELGQQVDDSDLTQQVDETGQQIDTSDDTHEISGMREQSHNGRHQQVEQLEYSRYETPNQGRRLEIGQRVEDSDLTQQVEDSGINKYVQQPTELAQHAQQQTGLIEPSQQFGQVEDGPGYLTKPVRQVSHDGQTEVGQQVEDSDLTQQIEETGQQIDNSYDTHEISGLREQSQHVGRGQQVEQLEYSRYETPNQGRRLEIGQQVEDSDLTQQVEDSGINKYVQQTTELGQHAHQQSDLIEPKRQYGQVEVGQQVDDSDLTQQIEETGQQIDTSDDTHEISGIGEQSQHNGRNQQVEQLEYSRHETPNQGKRLELGQQVDESDLTQQVEDSGIDKYLQQPTELGQHAQHQSDLIEPTRQNGQIEVGQQVDDSDLAQQVEDSGINKHFQQPSEFGQQTEQQQNEIGQQIEQLGYNNHHDQQGRNIEVGQVEEADYLTQQIEDSGLGRHYSEHPTGLNAVEQSNHHIGTNQQIEPVNNGKIGRPDEFGNHQVVDSHTGYGKSYDDKSPHQEELEYGQIPVHPEQSQNGHDEPINKQPLSTSALSHQIASNTETVSKPSIPGTQDNIKLDDLDDWCSKYIDTSLMDAPWELSIQLKDKIIHDYHELVQDNRKPQQHTLYQKIIGELPKNIMYICFDLKDISNKQEQTMVSKGLEEYFKSLIKQEIAEVIKLEGKKVNHEPGYSIWQQNKQVEKTDFEEKLLSYEEKCSKYLDSSIIDSPWQLSTQLKDQIINLYHQLAHGTSKLEEDIIYQKIMDQLPKNLLHDCFHLQDSSLSKQQEEQVIEGLEAHFKSLIHQQIADIIKQQGTTKVKHLDNTLNQIQVENIDDVQKVEETIDNQQGENLLIEPVIPHERTTPKPTSEQPKTFIANEDNQRVNNLPTLSQVINDHQKQGDNILTKPQVVENGETNGISIPEGTKPSSISVSRPPNQPEGKSFGVTDQGQFVSQPQTLNEAENTADSLINALRQAKLNKQTQQTVRENHEGYGHLGRTYYNSYDYEDSRQFGRHPDSGFAPNPKYYQSGSSVLQRHYGYDYGRYRGGSYGSQNRYRSYYSPLDHYQSPYSDSYGSHAYRTRNSYGHFNQRPLNHLHHYGHQEVDEQNAETSHLTQNQIKPVYSGVKGRSSYRGRSYQSISQPTSPQEVVEPVVIEKIVSQDEVVAPQVPDELTSLNTPTESLPWWKRFGNKVKQTATGLKEKIIG